MVYKDTIGKLHRVEELRFASMVKNRLSVMKKFEEEGKLFPCVRVLNLLSPSIFFYNNCLLTVVISVVFLSKLSGL